MPTSSRSHRRGHEEKGKMGNLAKRSASFHGRNPEVQDSRLRRPKTVPDLLQGRRVVDQAPEIPPRLTKLLLNVTIQASPGAVQVVLTLDSTVGDLIAAAVRQYAKEGRRPFLPATDSAGFDLHYSQFSLESLEREAKLMTLGSRNFFLCPVKTSAAGATTVVAEVASSSTCCKQAEKVSRIPVPWLRFIDFLF